MSNYPPRFPIDIFPSSVDAGTVDKLFDNANRAVRCRRAISGDMRVILMDHEELGYTGFVINTIEELSGIMGDRRGETALGERGMRLTMLDEVDTEMLYIRTLSVVDAIINHASRD